MKQTLTVRAIIKQDQKVLLLRRVGGNPLYQGLFELPGGKVDFGEDPRATLQREITEEINREAETLQLFDVHSELDVRDVQHQYIVLVFLVSLKPDTTIDVSNEHDKYAWKKVSEIQLNEVTETTRLALQLEKNVPETGMGASSTMNYVENGTTKIEELIVYTDGGSRGNPGPSASGFVIQDGQERVIFEGGRYLGITTNNQAEYQAVKVALEKALEIGGRRLSCRLDSQLVVNQLTGVYQIKNRDLWPIHQSIKDLIKKFEKVTFTHVRREFNKDADAMVNKILDEQERA
ncbi:MAG TPA: reverse transcriptase-like protein [Candidatus Saccharimonadales bacterium]|nr:reverse transcriptase-like protein [Candidatus Saccharimonadales bacterium]